MMSKDLVLAGLRCCFIDILLYWDIDIIHLATFQTANMVMGLYGCIKTFLGAAYLQLENHACFRHQFKISIDSSQAYARKTSTYHVIDFIGCWV